MATTPAAHTHQLLPEEPLPDIRIYPEGEPNTMAIGTPLGLGETVTTGVVSAVRRTVSKGTGAYLTWLAAERARDHVRVLYKG